MQKSAFNYHLPSELIANFPTAERSGSRLLCVNGSTGEREHSQFINLPSLLQPGDLLVFNNTRVIPARLFGKKSSGGAVEILVERLLDENHVLAHIRSSKSPKPNANIILDTGEQVVMLKRHDALFELQSTEPWLTLLERSGHMPLPPYIEREDAIADRERYQTVYASAPGAVAAPTAGLHFDNDMLERLKAKGVETAEVTLHVGAGTFQPVRTDAIEEHHMHSEWLDVSAQVCEQIKRTKQRGGRVIAVGTTAVRSLESAALFSQPSTMEDSSEWELDQLQPYRGDTNIFLYPGKRFHVVDALITNFHLPESTLIMLVSAFIGYQRCMDAYQEAVAEKYRFFSYGDAMFLTMNPQASLDIPNT